MLRACILVPTAAPAAACAPVRHGRRTRVRRLPLAPDARDGGRRRRPGGPGRRAAHGGGPLEARILATCDVYDALTSWRTYREPWTRERALRLIESETGAAFDPVCARALHAVLGDAEPAAGLAA